MDAAAHQFIGMMCVFYWKYKFNASKPTLHYRTDQRLQKAINSSTIDTPDISTRKKVIDFEYDNFNSMLHDLPLDVELKYPGVSFFEPEIVLPKIQSLFNSEQLYFKRIESLPNTKTIYSTMNKPLTNAVSKTTESSSGCLGFVILFIVTSLLMAYSM